MTPPVSSDRWYFYTQNCAGAKGGEGPWHARVKAARKARVGKNRKAVVQESPFGQQGDAVYVKYSL